MLYEVITQSLEQKHKIGNASVYKTVRNSLWKFKPNQGLRFSDISLKFLEDYEAHLVGEGLKGLGIALYMRTLRAAYNKAIAAEITMPDLYPFHSQAKPNGYKISDRNNFV